MKHFQTKNNSSYPAQRLLIGVLVFFSMWYFLGGISNDIHNQLEKNRSIKNEESVVLALIEDDSFKKYGIWPWKRDVFADFHTNVSKQSPSVIGYDVLFFESTENDKKLAEAFENDTNVVLASSLEIDTIKKPIFNSQSGYIQVGTGWSEVVDSTFLYTITDAGNCEFSFALKLYQQSKNLSQKQCNEEYILFDNGEKFPRVFKFSFGYTNDSVDFVDFVTSENTGRYKDKMILVGVETSDVQGQVSDNVATIKSAKTTGIKVQSAILNSLINRTYYTTFPLFLNLSSAISVLILLIFFGRFQKNFITISLPHILSLILVLVGGLVLFYYYYIVAFIEIIAVVIIDGLLMLIRHYRKEEKEKKLLAESFGKYVSPDIVDRIIEGRQSLELGGEEIEIGVMFFDIRGFTALTEEKSPKEVVELLNEVFTMVSNVVTSKQGMVDKYMGDGMMALWNCPIEVQNYTTYAIDAGYEIIKECKKYNKKNNTSINIGIAIHKGLAVVGNIGSANHLSYTAVGDVVNTTSRIESLTKEYGVSFLTTDIFKRGYTGKLSFLEVDTVIIKGKKSKTQLFYPYYQRKSDKHNFMLFENGREYYYSGKFDKAVEYLEKVVDFPPALTLIRRIKAMSESQISNWNGIWVMESK